MQQKIITTLERQVLRRTHSFFCHPPYNHNDDIAKDGIEKLQNYNFLTKKKTQKRDEMKLFNTFIAFAAGQNLTDFSGSRSLTFVIESIQIFDTKKAAILGQSQSSNLRVENFRFFLYN